MMCRERTAVKKIREILRYKYDHQLSNECVALALNIAKGTVYNVLHRFEKSGLQWPLSEGYPDSELEKNLYGLRNEVSDTHLPDIKYLEKELLRPHVTLQRLYEEYQQQSPNGLGRTQFYEYFSRYRTSKPEMKVIHKGGDLLYVDYSGDGLEYVDRSTGECIPVQLFVCSWGASSYCYAEVTLTQKVEEYVISHDHAFQYFKAVPHGLVPDNLKSAVSKANRYDPIVNPLYTRLAEHYQTVIIPARVRKPKDKAVVESNVLHIQRFILARLRNKVFHSLSEVNQAVQEDLELYNNRPMKDHGNKSRKERFDELDRPYAFELPPERFTITKIKQDVRVAPNYHVRYEDHYYSVPHEHARRYVDIYQVGDILEIYYDNKHICRHRFCTRKYGYTTIKEHMPLEHQFVKGWSKEYFLAQADKIGPATVEVVKITMTRQQHVQQGFNAALGILRFAQMYSSERLEKACERALYFNTISFRHLKAIFDQNLDAQPLQSTAPDITEPVDHENIRGAQYYQLSLEFTHA